MILYRCILGRISYGSFLSFEVLIEDGGGLTNTSTVMFTLEDGNRVHEPIIEPAITNLFIREDINIGATAYMFSAIDADGGLKMFLFRKKHRLNNN